MAKENEYRLAEPVLRKNNIDISSHTSKPVDSETLQNADLIIALGDNILNGNGGLKNFGEDIINKTIVCEVSDPAEESALNKYEIVVPEIISTVGQITPRIMNLLDDDETKKELDSKLKARNSKEVK